MILTLYRIYDVTDDETLADGIDNYAFATETLSLLQDQYPNNTLEIESYTRNTVRPGFGRDPDLRR